jgi:outer membrane protein assembly factor BamD
VFWATFPIQLMTNTPRRHRFATLATYGVVLCILSGCWGSSSDETRPDLEPKELTTEKEPLDTEVPEIELVRLSKKLYQARMYSLARDSFNSLKDRYPLGAYTTFAEVKVADSYFYNGQFNEAAKSYEAFLKNYPGHIDTPYMKLQGARSHIASARGGGRDRQPLERGLALYDELILEYPNTAYSTFGQNERQPVIEQLAAYDRDIIEFYRKVGNDAAVREREQKYQQRWAGRLPTETPSPSEPTPEVPEATLQNLAEVAPPPVPTPATEFPEGNTDETLESKLSPLVEGRIVVRRVHCETSGVPFGTIELTSLPESIRHTLTAPETLQPYEGHIVVQNLGLTSRQLTFDCFTSQDITITPEGDLEILSEKPLALTVMEEPARILLSSIE